MTMRVRRLSVAALLLALLAVTGCSNGDETESPRAKTSKAPDKVLVKGTCWDDELLPDALGAGGFADWVEKYAGGDSARGESMRDDAAFSEKVDCAEPHALELYNVVALSPALNSQVKEYGDLLDQSTPLYRKVRDEVNNRCHDGSAYGQAQRRAGNLPVQLGPSLSTDGGLHVAWDPFPADLWDKGERKFVCLFEQDQPGTLRFADLTTRKVPVGARVCLNTPRKDVPCQGRHQAEEIAEMILNTAIERGQITGAKAVRTGADGPYVALSDRDYAKLDKICSTLLGSVTTRRGGLEARAYPGAVAQWPSKDTGAYVARCFALKPFEPPPMITGTVFNRG